MPQSVTKTRSKKKNKGKKAAEIIICVILAIAVAASAFIGIVTRKQSDTDKDITYIGGMLKSDSIEYKSNSVGNLDKNPIIKLMEMVWYFCADGDEKKHSTQTPPNVEIKKDIPYIDDGNLYHKYDVFYPKNTDPNAKLPVIIDIHGGGWMYATKDLNEYYCRELANRGFAVFSMSYRLVPDVIVPEQLQDVMAALKCISSEMKNYPCDENSIMLTGDSAGGMMAAYSAVLLQSAELRDVFEVNAVDMNISALLLTSPVAYMKDGALSVYTKILWGSDYKRKNTYNYMNFDEIIDYATALPPTYLITSSGDTLARKQTQKLAALLESKGVETTLKDYPKYNGKSLAHVYSVLFPFDEAGSEMIDGAIDFYREILSR